MARTNPLQRHLVNVDSGQGRSQRLLLRDKALRHEEFLRHWQHGSHNVVLLKEVHDNLNALLHGLARLAHNQVGMQRLLVRSINASEPITVGSRNDRKILVCMQTP